MEIFFNFTMVNKLNLNLSIKRMHFLVRFSIAISIGVAKERLGHRDKKIMMRRMLLLALLTIGYQLPAFSQSGSPTKTGPTGKPFVLGKVPLTIHPVDSIDFKGFLKNPADEKYFPGFKLNDKNIHFGQLRTLHLETPPTFDNMPCVKPQGPFNMPVYKPDSSVNYTLLIKKP